MSKNNFFIEQRDNTAIKLKFYRDYIERYLITLLMQFGKCFVCDLFCGPGMNGTEKGSPLILIEIANRILENTILKQKHKNPQIVILFNDKDSSLVDNLKKKIEGMNKHPGIKLFFNQELFSNIMDSKIMSMLNNENTKFIFLDPFDYSTIKLQDLKRIMALPFTEVLFFSPTFHAYRFAGCRNKLPGKLKNFLRNFTAGGIIDYFSFPDFIDSICNKLKSELGTNLVKPILIDSGGSKNTLFYITRHIMGMMIINEMFLKESSDGNRVFVKEVKNYEKNPRLFKKFQIETADFKQKINKYQVMLLDNLKEKRKMTNKEIIYHSVVNGLLPKYAEELILKLRKEGKIEYEYLRNNKKRGPYVSRQNWDNDFCVVHYKDI